jgi:hypothetical protein
VGRRTIYQVGRGRGCASEKDPLRWIVACVRPDKTVSARNATLTSACVVEQQSVVPTSIVREWVVTNVARTQRYGTDIHTSVIEPFPRVRLCSRVGRSVSRTSGRVIYRKLSSFHIYQLQVLCYIYSMYIQTSKLLYAWSMCRGPDSSSLER